MASFLVDESCPRAVAEALRSNGHDVRYAAETDRRAVDSDLVALAQSENRLIVSEDFDFGELLVRRMLKAPGAIILYMPQSSPQDRASRLVEALERGLVLEGRVTIVTGRKIRQRVLET